MDHEPPHTGPTAPEPAGPEPTPVGDATARIKKLLAQPTAADFLPPSLARAEAAPCEPVDLIELPKLPTRRPFTPKLIFPPFDAVTDVPATAAADAPPDRPARQE
ncbi:hypothetical protein [Saccharothrix sp. HUAS TT1]|uniref:hypothetical protein n=1 Tax=unclassified Saccharothrix TaxID=2593673 RepID=UPI00345C413D